MRIAMVAACPFPWPRGTPVRIHRLAEALGERGHEVHVVTYHLGEPLPQAPFTVHRIRNVPSYRFCDPGPTIRKLLYLDPLLTLKLRRVLASARFDLIHAHHYEGLLAGLAALPGRRDTPLIYDAHTLLASELPFYHPKLSRRLKSAVGGFLDRQLPRRADHIIAVSEEIRRVLSTCADAPGISVIRNGVEVAHFAAADAPSKPGPSDPVVAFAGNLAAYQGIDLLLRSFVRVISKVPGARLRLLTDSSFAPYETLARSLGIRESIEVRPTTYQALPSRLRDARVLVNPRIECDGIPQKLLNYMATAKPIVSFAGSAKLLEHERSGLIVPDGDVKGFAAAICRVLDEPDRAITLGATAQRLVAAQYGWNHVAARVEEVYRRLLAQEGMATA